MVLQNNELVGIYEKVIRYTADTEVGSSGSPIFDNSWTVIGLHHAGGEQNAKGTWLNNEGIRIDRIVDFIKEATKNNVAITEELGI